MKQQLNFGLVASLIAVSSLLPYNYAQIKLDTDCEAAIQLEDQVRARTLSVIPAQGCLVSSTWNASVAVSQVIVVE